MQPLDHAGGEEVAVEVLLEALLDVGPEHLDGHRPQPTAGLADGGLMHLRDGGGRYRRTEFGEELFDGGVQRLLDGLPRLGLRERGQAVLQGGKVGGELAADDVVAGGEKLPELDVGGTKGGERGGEPRLVAGRLALALPVTEPRGQAPEQLKRRRQRDVVRQHARAAPCDDGAGMGEPHHIGDGTHGITAARRSGERRCRPSGCDSAPARSRHSRSVV